MPYKSKKQKKYLKAFKPKVAKLFDEKEKKKKKTKKKKRK
tara:strand:+ start:123 stop:242 length:120 start_codon:yes stop_codon:yes gene_type:complete